MDRPLRGLVLFFGGSAVNLSDQKRYCELFFSNCIGVLNNRSRDYAPEGIPLLQTLRPAVEADIGIVPALWQLYSKQHTAIVRYVRGGALDSDSITSRLTDAANLLALISFYEANKDEFHAMWLGYWLNEECPCVPGYPQSDCHRHRTLMWLQPRLSPLVFGRILSHSTRKAQDWYRTDRLRTGGIGPPAPLPSPSATPKGTPPTSGGLWTRARGKLSWVRSTNKTP